MKKIRLLCAGLWLALLPVVSIAQIQPLGLQDAVPDLRFSSLVNSPVSSMRLSQFKGKAVIIDFWHTHCGGCIKKMPVMSELQRKFRNDLQIIMVTWEDKPEVDAFYASRPQLQQLQLVSVTGDSILRQYFPYDANPHIVWIGADRKVAAITEGEYLNEGNIVKLVKGYALSLPLKDDWRGFDYDSPEPLLTGGTRITDGLLTYSTLTKGVDNLKSVMGFITIDSMTTKVRAINQSLMGLYSIAYSRYYKFAASNWRDKVKMDFSNSRLLYDPEDSNQLQKYCYELLPPRNGKKSMKRDELLAFMQKDLDRLFGLHSYVDTAEQECYVVTPIGSGTTVPTSSQSELIGDLQSSIFINMPVTSFITAAKESYEFGLPLLYEGDKKILVNGVLQRSYTNLNDVKSAMASLGFSIIKSVRPTAYLVIEDAKTGLAGSHGR